MIKIHYKQLSFVVLVAMIALSVFVLAAPMATAQDGNLLLDPGFEGNYTPRGRADLNVSAPWQLYNADGPRNFEWQNRADKVFAFPHRSQPEIHSGALSQNLNGGWVTFNVVLYQTVSVPADTNINGSIWARIKTCNIGPNADNCGSAVESGAYVKVGIDPTGGTNPFSGSVAWSSNIAPHDTWQQASVSVKTTGTTATLFAFFAETSPAELNNVWFDDAYLGTGGSGGAVVSGGATAVPTARPIPTAFVALKQLPRPDGSQYHIVQQGDTLTGISSAYNVAIDRIMELNSLVSSRFIFVGQELLIIPAGAAGAATPTRQRGGALPVAPAATLNPEQQAWLTQQAGGGSGSFPTPVGMTSGG